MYRKCVVLVLGLVVGCDMQFFSSLKIFIQLYIYLVIKSQHYFIDLNLYLFGLCICDGVIYDRTILFS